MFTNCHDQISFGCILAAPRLIKNLNAKLVKKDEESKVVCTVERSNPWPTFQWKYQAMSCPDLQKGCTPDPLQWKSIPAEPSSQVPTNQSVVTVARDVQNTFYLCQAINVVGNDSQVTRLVRTGKIVSDWCMKSTVNFINFSCIYLKVYYEAFSKL